MAYFSPTIAANRARSAGSTALGGLSSIRARPSGPSDWIDDSQPSSSQAHRSPRRRGTSEAVVDGFAETVGGDRHDRDRARAGGIERAKLREQIGRRLDEIAAFGKVEHAFGPPGAFRRRWSEGEQRLAGLDAAGVQPQPRPRRVMRVEHAGCERSIIGAGGKRIGELARKRAL